MNSQEKNHFLCCQTTRCFWQFPRSQSLTGILAGKSQAAIEAQHGSRQLHSSSSWNPQRAQSVRPFHMIPQESILNTEGHKGVWGQETWLKYLCGYVFWLGNGSYLLPCCTWLTLRVIIIYRGFYRIYIFYWRMVRQNMGLTPQESN